MNYYYFGSDYFCMRVVDTWSTGMKADCTHGVVAGDQIKCLFFHFFCFFAR